MIERTCNSCTYSQTFDEFMGWQARSERPDPATVEDHMLNCTYPTGLLPRCMDDIPMDRRRVEPTETGCHTWTEHKTLT